MAFDVDPEIARARALPPAQYTDPAALDAERQRVFARSWQLVTRADAVAVPGAYAAVELAGEPVLIVRGDDGLRGFYNVCPHRGGPLARGCGRRKTIQCGYHGWTFDLDGRLLHAPDAGLADLGDVQLVPVQVATWGPLVFAAIEPPPRAGAGSATQAWGLPTLDEQLAGIAVPPAMTWVMRRDYLLACNWKVYVDNYLEGYHIPVVHPELHKELDYERYRTVTDRWWSRQHAPLRPIPGDAAARHYRPERDDEEAEYFWVFPNLMLNIYQGQLQTNVVVPLAVDQTRVEFEWYAVEPPADPATDDKWTRLVSFSDLLQVQDTAICETVQRNLGSRGAQRGRYAPRRENGVHHFHALLAEALR